MDYNMNQGSDPMNQESNPMNQNMNPMNQGMYNAPAQQVNSPSPKKKNNKAASIIAGILIGALAIFMLATAIIDLTKMGKAKEYNPLSGATLNEGDYVEVTIHFGAKIGTNKHTINFIPIGTEHYYGAICDDRTTLLLIRESKSFDKNFDENSLSEKDVIVKGKVRKLDSKLQRELSSELAQLSASGLNIPTSGSSYIFIDGMTKTSAILKLICFGAYIVGALLLIIVSKKSGVNKKNQALGVVAGILLIGATIVLLHTTIYM
ncbi:hypothetical protein [Eubacterium ruminantium]|uniref:hypothetical protein n=1 Tax=Eubacterium ruminantium TaxID=42322 RepID=UPI0015699602|nr:hypothetical protein [Eubacterium ruminantium]